MRMTARTCAAATVAAAALFLGACGGSATVTDDSTATSVPVATNTGGAAASTTAKQDASSSSSSATASSGAPAATAEQGSQDGGAREVPSPAAQSAPLQPVDHDYLDALKDGGINVDGVEDQLIATARNVYQAQQEGGESYLLDAVAGQLQEQGRTQDDPQQVAQVIARSAQQAYC